MTTGCVSESRLSLSLFLSARGVLCWGGGTWGALSLSLSLSLPVSVSPSQLAISEDSPLLITVTQRPWEERVSNGSDRAVTVVGSSHRLQPWSAGVIVRRASDSDLS